MKTKTILHSEKKKEPAQRALRLREGEELTYIYLHTLPSSEETAAQLSFTLEKGSKLTLWNLIFGGKRVGLKEHIHFSGEAASCENSTVYFGDETQKFELFITHLHEAPNGRSRMFSRGILKDAGSARFDGMIKILQTGKKTDALLEEKALLLSPDAKSEAIPGLEIGTNDVRAAHSASATRVDTNQLFYAASRGIAEEEALRMIAEGFLKSLLERLPHEEVKKTCFSLVYDKLNHGAPAFAH